MEDTTSRETQESNHQIGAGERFLDSLRQKGLIQESKEFKQAGVAATEGTNEVGNLLLFEKVRQQEQAPNGYLIGIGAANVFSMLEAFPQGREPKAIILFDIDPAVVAEGQRLIQGFRDTTADSATPLDPWEKIFNTNYNAYPENAMKKYARLLHRLAQEGNLIIAQADFNNPELARAISELPDFRESNNVIYLSNIIDHIHRRGVSENIAFAPNLNSLPIMEPTKPHRNYYIDTLQHGLAYRLRISTFPPQFSRKDFNPRADLSHIQTELTDQIGGPNENILWEDITNWPLEQVIQYYHQIIDSPIGRERRQYIEERIRESRSNTLQNYTEYKKLSTQPPKEIYPGRFRVYDIPTDPAEEARLLKDLQSEYSYERDFIPFVAHSYWHDAKTVGEVDRYRIPRRERPSFTTKEDWDQYMKYSRINPRESAKGSVELGFMEGFISYEDLALAKLYREMEKRVFQRKSGAVTQGKTFYELSKEAVPPY